MRRGFPSETGNGNYLSSAGLLVVNKNTANQEAVAYYLEYLLSEEGQANFGTWISPRKNSIKVYYDSDGSAMWGNTMLDMKEDGSTYVEEFEAFLENCMPIKRSYEALSIIISEEADVYFNSEQSAEETARIIDNRIQLYLDKQ